MPTPSPQAQAVRLFTFVNSGFLFYFTNSLFNQDLWPMQKGDGGDRCHIGCSLWPLYFEHTSSPWDDLSRPGHGRVTRVCCCHYSCQFGSYQVTSTFLFFSLHKKILCNFFFLFSFWPKWDLEWIFHFSSEQPLPTVRSCSSTKDHSCGVSF